MLKYRFISFLLLISELSAVVIIHGTIIDAKTEKPIVGANILIVGTQLGAATNVHGTFTLEVNNEIPFTLKISHITYETKTVIINTSEDIVIRMIPTVIKGKEIEVVGTKPKYELDVTSSVDLLDIKEIERQGARDLGSALRRISSIKMDLSSSGKQTISIRGSNANDVAVFLDGVRLNDANTGVADLSTIDLNSLKKVQVIKGGSSSLYGSDAMGGVLNLEPKTATQNTVYFTRGQGLTFDNDLDLSIGATGVWGLFGVGGRYSHRSRAYANRTLTTDIFQNLFTGGELDFGRVDAKWYRLEKIMQFPSGGLTTADGLTIISLKYHGRLFNTSGWDLLIGQRQWSITKDFLSSLIEELEDGTQNIRLSKIYSRGNFEGTLQLEADNQFFNGDKSYFNFYGDVTVKHRAQMKRQTRALAMVTRWTVPGGYDYIDDINWELGLRFNRIGTTQEEWFESPLILIDGEPIAYKNPRLYQFNTINSKHLGVQIEGHGESFYYSLFINQGSNSRLPTLSDYFHLTYAENDESVDSSITSEYLTTTDVSLNFTFPDIHVQLPISKVELSLAMFINNYTNKIAYRFVEVQAPVPFNVPMADIRGVEGNLIMDMLDDKFVLSFSGTWLDVSNLFVFPNKPGYRYVLTGEFYLDWLVISYDHVFEGKQYYFFTGIGEGMQKPREKANLNISLHRKWLGLNWTLSYTWRNLLTKDESNLTLEESLRRGFNYFEKYREVITFKVDI